MNVKFFIDVAQLSKLISNFKNRKTEEIFNLNLY